MPDLRSIRRLALGAAVAGAALGAAPAFAGAATTCTYIPEFKSVEVNDGSGTQPLRISNFFGFITLRDTLNGSPVFCAGRDGNSGNMANTTTIEVFGPVSTNVDGLVVDLTGGPISSDNSGHSAIPITAFTNDNRRPSLTVTGDNRQDTIKVTSDGLIDRDHDDKVDVKAAAGASFVTLNGGGGDDLLGGDGFLGLGSTTVPLFLNGGAGGDQLIGGLAHDEFDGGSGDDVFHARDGSNDTIFGGSGFDTANADKSDRFTDVVEQRFIDPIGRLRLAPRTQKAEAGMIARLQVGWMHPRSWRQLRGLKVRLYAGKEAVGLIDARPATGRLTGSGAVELMPGSTLGHHGKWVTASLVLRMPKSAAGQELRADVTAVDTRGRTQVERGAGAIRVTSAR